MLRPHVLVQCVIVEDHVFVAEVAGVVHQLDDLLLGGTVQLPVLGQALFVMASHVLPQEGEIDCLVTSATECLDTVSQRVAVELRLHHLGLLDDEGLGGFSRPPLPTDDDLVSELLCEKLAHLATLLDWKGLVCTMRQHSLL